MSELKKIGEMQVNTANMAVKFLKFFGWFLIVVGAIFTITIIGSALGIPMIIFGGLILWGSKKVAKSNESVAGYANEVAELHEHRMQEMRDAKARTIARVNESPEV